MKDCFASKITKKKLFGILATILILGMVFSSVHTAQALVDEPLMDRVFKAASKQEVKLGEIFTYTIHLDMGLSTIVKAQVTDPLPKELEYIPGSANYSGVYDPDMRTITWIVSMGGMATPVDLMFNVKNATAVKEPMPVVNTATIAYNDFILQRQAWVTLMPDGTGGSNLSGSFKAAKPRMLYAGDTVFYSIHLLNSGTEAAAVQVVDPIPNILTYVPDSANNGGVYNPETKTITWKEVLVPPYSPLLPVEPVTLLFAAKVPRAFIGIYPIEPIIVTNTAEISSGTVAFKRSVDIMVIPQVRSPLEGSFKTASLRSVYFGQTFTYSIFLNNSSPVGVTASVSDLLPAQVSYVEGSANANGQYDQSTHTLTWKQLTVLEGSTLVLKFDVVVDRPTMDIKAGITNTANISSSGVILKRSVTTPVQPPPGDIIPPVVRSLVIGTEDVHTSPDTVLQIAAADNIGVAKMYLQEWVLNTVPFPHWELVNSSGWVPYEAKYPWKFSELYGTHYMAVWVADAAGNKSRLTRSSIDFASLLLPGSKVSQGGLIPYMVYYPAGVEVTAELKVRWGAADLFVWYPGNLFYPDRYNPTPGINPQKVNFTTPVPGIYLFLVYGKEMSHYDLSIVPGGGPRVPIVSIYGSTVPDPGITRDATTTSTTPELDGMTYNPIFPQSGLDPLDIAQEPGGTFLKVFLPAIVR